MKRIKILEHVMQHKPGDVIEVSDWVAGQLLLVHTDAEGIVHEDTRRAILESDAIAEEKKPKDVGTLTAAEMNDMGISNKTDTSSAGDPVAEALARIKDKPSIEVEAPVETLSNEEAEDLVKSGEATIPPEAIVPQEEVVNKDVNGTIYSPSKEKGKGKK